VSADRVSRKLPRSFSEFGPVSSLLFENLARATELFAEIADKEGVEEAERIFNDVVQRARKFVPRKQGRRPGIQGAARLREAQILSLSNIVRSQIPAASDRKIARFYLDLCESKKKPKEVDIRRATALLNRARARQKRGTKIP
jgi:hypothetical protein